MISVVVAIYNVKNYIVRCVESIIKQTYKDLQIILVDDGSTDGTSKICDKFAKKDNRIIVIHKPNGGVSSARNTGIECAKGKYIHFMDGDDFLKENFYEELLMPITLYGDHILPEASKTMVKEKDLLSFKYPECNNDHYRYEPFPAIVVFRHLFNTQSIKDHNIRFRNCSHYEDAMFNIEYAGYVQPKILYCFKACYVYIIRDGSLSHNKNFDCQRKVQSLKYLEEFYDFCDCQYFDKELLKKAQFLIDETKKAIEKFSKLQEK